MNWFLYGRDHRRDRVKTIFIIIINLLKVDDKKFTSSRFITIVVKLINVNEEHSSVKIKKTCAYAK